jgi:hypothetical protein
MTAMRLNKKSQRSAFNAIISALIFFILKPILWLSGLVVLLLDKQGLFVFAENRTFFDFHLGKPC